MKKIKIAIGILIFISIILVSRNIFAAGMNLDSSICFIDEEGYDDWSLDVSHYAPKCTLSSGVKASYSTSGDKRIGKYNNYGQGVKTYDTKMDVNIKIEANDKIYVGDTLTIVFYIIDDASSLNFSTIRLEGNKEDYKTDSYYAKISNVSNYDGKPHMKVKFQITFSSKGSMGSVPINLIVKDKPSEAGEYSAKINIQLPWIYDHGQNSNDILMKEGYRLVTGLGDGYYGSVSRSKAWMIKQGVVSEEKVNSSVINFTEYKVKDVIDKLTKGEITFENWFTTNVPKNIEAYYGNENKWKWTQVNPGYKFSINYKFVYNDNNGALYYKLIIDKMGETTNQDANNDAENRLNNALQTNQELAEAAKKRLLKIIPKDEERTEVEFTDVLQDISKYEVTESLEADDAQKAEEKIGKVLSVITNIGMVLSVIMPAILGVKYMLGSVEEKAEYKKDMIPYFVGAVLLFSICTIVKVMKVIGEEINKI